jgi:hypothetical protein
MRIGQQGPGDSSSGVDFNLSEEVQNKNLHLESLTPVCDIPRHRLHFNRGGRKAIIDSSISLGLWPFILERAYLRIGYYEAELLVKHRGSVQTMKCLGFQFFIPSCKRSLVSLISRVVPESKLWRRGFACKGNETELRLFGFIISRLKSQDGYLV